MRLEMVEETTASAAVPPATKIEGGPVGLVTKVCPCCGALVYGDMDVCYECLFDFSRMLHGPVPQALRTKTPPAALGDPSLDEPDLGPPASGAPTSPDHIRATSAAKRLAHLPSLDDTVDLSAATSTLGGARAAAGMVLRTPSADVWVEVPEEGITLGRDPSADVVLHVPTVSRQHLRLAATPDGMEVTDLDATNPATYAGRPVRDCVIVPYGESVEVCGCVLEMLAGTSPSS